MASSLPSLRRQSSEQVAAPIQRVEMDVGGRNLAAIKPRRYSAAVLVASLICSRFYGQNS
jgi:hypothetical protein